MEEGRERRDTGDRHGRGHLPETSVIAISHFLLSLRKTKEERARDTGVLQRSEAYCVFCLQPYLTAIDRGHVCLLSHAIP